MKILLLNREEELIKFISTISVKSTEIINGHSTFEFSTTYSNIEKNYRVLFKDQKNQWHEYIIKGVQFTRSNKKKICTCFCENSIYEIIGDYIEDRRFTNAVAAAVLRAALSPTRWDVGTVENLPLQTINFYNISSFNALEEILKKFQCEFSTTIKVAGNKIVSRKVNLFKKLGDDKGKRFTYKKDIQEITRIVSEDDIITALYGFGKGELLEGGSYGRRINFSNLNNGKEYVENNEMRKLYGRNSKNGEKVHIFGKIIFDEIEDKAQLLELTTQKLKEFSAPKVSYKAKVEDLSKYGFKHEGVSLGDTVTVIDKEMDILVKARIVKLVRYFDKNKNDEIEVSNFVDTKSDAFIEANKQISLFKDKAIVWDSLAKKFDNGIDASYLNNVIEKLNTEINSGRAFIDISEEGITTYDKPKDQNPTKAIQIKGGSIRIANGKNSDGSWNWRSFGTGDGFVADEIITGKLKGRNVELNLNDGSFILGPNEENYSLKFDGSTLSFGEGALSKESLNDELKEELSVRQKFNWNIISFGDCSKFNGVELKNDTNEYKFNLWINDTDEQLNVLISEPQKSMYLYNPTTNTRISTYQFVDLKENKKYFFKIKAKGNLNIYFEKSARIDGYYFKQKIIEINSNEEREYIQEFDSGEGSFFRIRISAENKTAVPRVEQNPDNINRVSDIILSETKLKEGDDWFPSKNDIIGEKGEKGEQGEQGPRGQDGSLAELPESLKNWDSNATEINGKYIYTPEFFVGTSELEGTDKKTGIYMGKKIKTELSEKTREVDGMVGMKNGKATWYFGSDGNFAIGNKVGEQIVLGADGRAVIPQITSKDIKSGAITADKIEAGAITSSKIKAGAITADKLSVSSISTDMLIPGTNKRIVMEDGHSAGSNNAISIDANYDAIRLKYNSGTYMKVSSAGVESYYGGDMYLKAGGNEYTGIGVKGGALMNMSNNQCNISISSAWFLANVNGSTVLRADTGGLYSNGSSVRSDAKSKENISKVNSDKIILKKNSNINNTTLNSEEIYDFIKNLPLYNYNFKDDDTPRFSTMTQNIKSPFKEVLVKMHDNKHSIEIYNYISLIHEAFKYEIKKNESLEKRIRNLEKLILKGGDKNE